MLATKGVFFLLRYVLVKSRSGSDQRIGSVFPYKCTDLNRTSNPPPTMSNTLLQLETTVAYVVNSVVHVLFLVWNSYNVSGFGPIYRGLKISPAKLDFLSLRNQELVLSPSLGLAFSSSETGIGEGISDSTQRNT